MILESPLLTDFNHQRCVLIFGNSGSGKSTLAKGLCHGNKRVHLDLDTLAWQDTTPPRRKPLAVSETEIQQFLKQNTQWVIEGCYADLLEFLVSHADLMNSHCAHTANYSIDSKAKKSSY